MGELAEAGVTVRSLYHPVSDEDGGRESIIAVVIDPLPQERRDALGEEMSATLADVAGAVNDHGAMAGLMARSIEHLEGGPKGVAPEVLAENLEFLRWLQHDHFVFLARARLRLSALEGRRLRGRGPAVAIGQGSGPAGRPENAPSCAGPTSRRC
jgi:glutamate dehydrogenase